MIDEFDDIFEIMDEAFPDSEMRTYEKQKDLLNDKYYRIITKKNENNKVIAFMAVWEFNDFTFVEHLATSRDARGSGIGTKFLCEYINEAQKPIILEVEPPNTEIAKRRIGFYQRIGFCLNDFPYKQPPLREGHGWSPLMVMTYPSPIHEKEFKKYKDKIYKESYKIK